MLSGPEREIILVLGRSSPLEKGNEMNVLEKIETRFTETKTACKLYVDAASASKAAERAVAELNEGHNANIDCAFIVTFIPSQQKFTVVFDFSRWLMEYGTGTYLGWFADRKFFSI